LGWQFGHRMGVVNALEDRRHWWERLFGWNKPPPRPTGVRHLPDRLLDRNYRNGYNDGIRAGCYGTLLGKEEMLSDLFHD
jgi:hypothetical protein